MPSPGGRRSFELCPLCLSKAPGATAELCARCRGILPHRGATSRRLFFNVPGLAPCMALGAFYYEQPIPKVARQFKFHEQLQHAAWMGQAMARCYLRYRQNLMAGTLELGAYDLPKASAVLALPLHPSREAERGYNQAAVLAREVADGLGLPLLEDSLYRVKATRRQSAMRGREERHLNVKGAFAVRPERVRGQHILLVDDVATTGSSLQSAAESLMEGGAYGVLGLVFASDHRGFDEEESAIRSS